MGGANLALDGIVTLNPGQARAREGPSTLDKDRLSVRFMMKVNMPSMVPFEVIELGHALGKACIFEDVWTI